MNFQFLLTIILTVMLLRIYKVRTNYFKTCESNLDETLLNLPYDCIDKYTENPHENIDLLSCLIEEGCGLCMYKNETIAGCKVKELHFHFISVYSDIESLLYGATFKMALLDMLPLLSGIDLVEFHYYDFDAKDPGPIIVKLIEQYGLNGKETPFSDRGIFNFIVGSDYNIFNNPLMSVMSVLEMIQLVPYRYEAEASTNMVSPGTNKIYLLGGHVYEEIYTLLSFLNKVHLNDYLIIYNDDSVSFSLAVVIGEWMDTILDDEISVTLMAINENDIIETINRIKQLKIRVLMFIGSEDTLREFLDQANTAGMLNGQFMLVDVGIWYHVAYGYEDYANKIPELAAGAVTTLPFYLQNIFPYLFCDMMRYIIDVNYYKEVKDNINDNPDLPSIVESIDYLRDGQTLPDDWDNYLLPNMSQNYSPESLYIYFKDGLVSIVYTSSLYFLAGFRDNYYGVDLHTFSPLNFGGTGLDLLGSEIPEILKNYTIKKRDNSLEKKDDNLVNNTENSLINYDSDGLLNDSDNLNELDDLNDFADFLTEKYYCFKTHFTGRFNFAPIGYFDKGLMGMIMDQALFNLVNDSYSHIIGYVTVLKPNATKTITRKSSTKNRENLKLISKKPLILEKKDIFTEIDFIFCNFDENVTYFGNATKLPANSMYCNDNFYISEVTFDCVPCIEGFCSDGSLDEPKCYQCANEITKTKLETRIITGIIVILGCSACIASAIFLIHYRKRYFVKASSPIFLVGCFTFGLIGCIDLMYLCYDDTDKNGTCLIYDVVSEICYFMFYGILILKNFRIFLIFSNIRMNPKSFTDARFLIYAGILLFFSCLIGGLLVGINHDHRVIAYQKHQDNNVTMNVTYSCDYTYIGYLSIIMGYRIIIIVCGIYISIRIRNFPDAFNESKYIGMAIYFNALGTLAYLALLFYMDRSQDSHVIDQIVLITTSYTLSVVVIMFPKVVAVVTGRADNPRGKGTVDKRKKALEEVNKNEMNYQNKLLMEENFCLENRMNKMMEIIHH